ncbi:MAG: hypothetical protein HYS62_03395 [Candidatus Aenigmarchaeota archaeon]|nr:hypothetical protein [Candidatus Aenigmarchaeota archaeon]
MTRDLFIGFGIIAVSLLVLLMIFSPAEKIETSVSDVQKIQVQPATSNFVTVSIPAVDNQGNGVIAKLEVRTTAGEGRVLTNIDNLLFWVDTQYSIKVAEMVAENMTGADLSNIDLIYTIESDASVIEGGSAGAALTIATIAVLQNRSLPPDVMITGTINPDGTIGPVGAIFAKAKASKDVGAKIFLVPEGQGSQVNYIPEKSCEQIGSITFCKTEYKAQKLDISKDIGLDVKEVSNIGEALKYFVA